MRKPRDFQSAFVMSSEVACQAVALCEGWRHLLLFPWRRFATTETVRDSSTSVGMTGRRNARFWQMSIF